MKKHSKTPAEAAESRRRAESRLKERKKAEAACPRTVEDTQRLVHELEVHQIELEMQNEELQQARTQVEVLLGQYTELYDFAPTGYVTLNRDGMIRQVNLTGAGLLGVERARLTGRPFAPLVSDDSRPTFNAWLDRLFATQGKESCEVMIPKEGSEPLWAHIEARATEDGQECFASVVDITERKKAEQESQIASLLLKIMGGQNDLHQLIQMTTGLLKDRFDIEAVGIRLRDGEDFPYFETRGFPAAFVEAENFLCERDVAGQLLRDSAGNALLECMCGNILRGRFDPAKPHFTAHGSFWTNSTTQLMASIIEADRQGRRRNRCNSAGYESVALIPLRVGDTTVGLVQLNDRHQDRFTFDRIKLLERLADNLAVAIAHRQSMENVRKSEEFKQAVLDSVTSHITVLNRDGVIVAVNEPWRRFALENPTSAGEPPRNTGIGVNYLEVCRQSRGESAEGAMTTHDGIQAVLEGRRASFALEYPCHSPDKQRWFLMAVTPLGTDRRGAVVSHTSITERKQAEVAMRESEGRYRTLFEAMDEAFCVIEMIYDPDGKPADYRFLETNPAFLKQTGLTDALTKTMREMVPDHDAHWFEIYEKVVRTGEPIRIESPAVAMQRHYDVFAFRIGGERSPRVGLIFNDITGRKRAEESLRRTSDELEQRVQERTAELESANRNLESFSYSVSHDLRAPLRAVTGFAEIIARRHRANLNEEGRHYVDNIVLASQRMGRLIDDLLEYSRMGRRAVRRQPLPLRDVLDVVLNLLAGQIRETRAELILPAGLPVIRGDAMLLSQILTNLFSNALIYRQSGVPPRIVLACREEEGHVVLSVADNGIGIPAEHYEKIFNVFQRLHSDDEYPGTGIGLSTVKKAVDLLGGRVWVESAVGQGSAFWVELPRGGPVSSD